MQETASSRVAQAVGRRHQTGRPSHTQSHHTHSSSHTHSNSHSTSHPSGSAHHFAMRLARFSSVPIFVAFVSVLLAACMRPLDAQDAGTIALKLEDVGADVRLTITWTQYGELLLNLGSGCRGIPVSPGADGSKVFITVFTEAYLNGSCGFQYDLTPTLIKLAGPIQIMWKTSSRRQNVYQGTMVISRTLTSTSTLDTNVHGVDDNTVSAWVDIASHLAVCDEPSTTVLTVTTQSDVCLEQSFEASASALSLYAKTVDVRLVRADGTVQSILTGSIANMQDRISTTGGLRFWISTGDSICSGCEVFVSTLLGSTFNRTRRDETLTSTPPPAYRSTGFIFINLYSTSINNANGQTTDGGSGGSSASGVGIYAGAGAAGVAGIAAMALVVRRRRRAREHALRQADVDGQFAAANGPVYESRVLFGSEADVSTAAYSGADPSHALSSIGHIGGLAMYESTSVASLGFGSSATVHQLGMDAFNMPFEEVDAVEAEEEEA